MTAKKDIVVFISRSEPTCSECGEKLGRSAWITLDSKKKALCLECADLAHLAFLPAGDAALTRRAKKHSGLYAVVVRWARARKRYERQGLLVESEALDRAEEECSADEDARKYARKKAAARRAELDREYIAKFAERIRELYPLCPEGRGRLIAEHACRKYSGRVGRSAAARALDAHAVQLAVTAHVRHAETNYDEMLLQGVDRLEAREKVALQ
ncbi:MAG: DUF2293 domain-containing protein, partial [Desulfobacterales bacterium]|nr:DUF2293 domain-containing protein [Desulfobacterales bacterium]